MYILPHPIYMWLVGWFGPIALIMYLAWQLWRCSLGVIVDSRLSNASIALLVLTNFTFHDAWLESHVSGKCSWHYWGVIFDLSLLIFVSHLFVGSV